MTDDSSPANEAREEPAGPDAARPRTSRLAIASPIVAVLGVLTPYLIFCVLGAALGVVAINRIKRTGAGGIRWAIAGVAIGLVWIVVVFVLVTTGVVEPTDNKAG